MCAEIITATACLHNYAISHGDFWVDKGSVKGIDDHDPADNYHYWSEYDRQCEMSRKKAQQDLIINKFS